MKALLALGVVALAGYLAWRVANGLPLIPTVSAAPAERAPVSPSGVGVPVGSLTEPSRIPAPTSPTGGAAAVPSAPSTFSLPVGTLDAARVSGSELIVEGWAADPDTGAPVATVEVWYSGVRLGFATLGLTRTDVAQARARQDFLASGWRLRVPLTTLPFSSGTVRAAAFASSGKSATLNRAIAVSVPAGVAATLPAAPSPTLQPRVSVSDSTSGVVIGTRTGPRGQLVGL